MTQKQVPGKLFKDQDNFGLSLAFFAAMASEDRSSKVGAYIVDADGDPLIFGSNNIPKKLNRDIETRHYHPEKSYWYEHAELDAIFKAAKRGISLEGGTIYIPYTPCCACARGIISSGITSVVVLSDMVSSRWDEHKKRAKIMFKEAGVSFKKYNPKKSGPLPKEIVAYCGGAKYEF